MLCDGDWHVKSAAVKALCHLARNGIKEGLKLINHEDYVVRCAAVQELADMAIRGDKMVIEAVRKCQGDEDDDVKDAATNALQKMEQDASPIRAQSWHEYMEGA